MRTLVDRLDALLTWTQRDCRIGSLSGVPIILHRSMLWFFAPPLAVALVRGEFSLPVILSLLYGSVLAHEMSHAVVGRRFGKRLVNITVYPIGGVLSVAGPELPPREDLLMSAAGPLLNFAVAAVAAGLQHVVRGATGGCEPVFPVLYWLVKIHVVMGLFNLLPAHPLDGGRICRAVLTLLAGEFRARRWGAWAGVAVAAGAAPVLFLRGMYSGVVVLAMVGVMNVMALREARKVV